MPSNAQPLLTIAVPTFNRSRFLAELLEALAPQLAGESRVELIISDNASEDDTATLVQSFCSRGMKCRYIRNETNIGSDRNFLQCFREAAGEYFWLFGDDDVIVPGGLKKILSFLDGHSWDLVFIRPYAFRNRYDEKHVRDLFGRTAMKIADPVKFAALVGPMLTFISALIVNKKRLVETRAPDAAELLGSNLIQLGWSLPLLSQYQCGLVVYGGLVAGRAANSGGYPVSEVFGRNLKSVTLKLLASHPEIAASILNSTLRGWFPGMIIEARRHTAGNFASEDFHHRLAPVFGNNPRYWVFVYPAIKMPIRLAEALVKVQTRCIFRLQSAAAAVAGLVFLKSDYLARPES